jgi:hypothetical protein
MPRTKNVNGIEIAFTAEEEAARDAEEAAALAAKPLDDWKAAMAATDGVPRTLEDIYDALTTEQQAALATITADKIAAKKTLRGQKP